MFVGEEYESLMLEQPPDFRGHLLAKSSDPSYSQAAICIDAFGGWLYSLNSQKQAQYVPPETPKHWAVPVTMAIHGAPPRGAKSRERS